MTPFVSPSIIAIEFLLGHELTFHTGVAMSSFMTFVSVESAISASNISKFSNSAIFLSKLRIKDGPLEQITLKFLLLLENR